MSLGPDEELPPLDALVLVRLAAARASVGAAVLRAALAPLAAHRGSAAALDDDVEAALRRLVGAGLAERSVRAAAATAAGRKRAEEWLGRRPRAATFARDVAGRLLAGAAGPRPKDADALRAAVLAHAHGLPVQAPGAVRQLLAQRALGVNVERPLSPRQLQGVALARLTGSARPGDAEDAVRLLAARAVGAARVDAAALSRALVQRWLDGQPLASHAAPAGTAAPTSLQAFATATLETARATRTGRFGDDLVFVSHVHRALPEPRPALDAFKSRVLEAHRAGLLQLTRADLQGAMAAEDVASSEIRHLGATFHLLRI
ncbi:MAG: hypothetical protein IT370_32575 [Deltaproteobacteria bacterium]|nr:hypothetical protein [Deltaproteobacteria bacterium]